MLVSAGDDRMILLWDLATGTVVQRLSGHTDAVLDARFLLDGAGIISTGADRTIRRWNQLGEMVASHTIADGVARAGAIGRHGSLCQWRSGSTVARVASVGA